MIYACHYRVGRGGTKGSFIKQAADYAEALVLIAMHLRFIRRQYGNHIENITIIERG